MSKHIRIPATDILMVGISQIASACTSPDVERLSTYVRQTCPIHRSARVYMLAVPSTLRHVKGVLHFPGSNEQVRPAKYREVNGD